MGMITSLKGFFGIQSNGEYYEEEFPEGETDLKSETPTRKRTPRLLKFPSPRDKSIYTLQPTTYEDANIAADYLKAGSAIFVNLQNIEPGLGRRMVDVLSGVCYGVEGHSHKIGDRLFLFLPHDYYITSEEKTHLELQGLFLNGFREMQRAGVSAKPNAEKTSSSQGQASFERAGLWSYNSNNT